MNQNNQNNKDLEINALKEKVEIAKEIMDEAEKKITKIQLTMIKHKISQQKILDEINKTLTWLQEPQNKIPTTEVDIETEKMNQELQEINQKIDTNKQKIMQIINELVKEVGNNIPIEHIIEKAKEQEINEEDTIEALDRLTRAGDTFKPRRDIISKM